jgi:hypothetical protein
VSTPGSYLLDLAPKLQAENQVGRDRIEERRAEGGKGSLILTAGETDTPSRVGIHLEFSSPGFTSRRGKLEIYLMDPSRFCTPCDIYIGLDGAK